jgi:hypothetical protein
MVMLTLARFALEKTGGDSMAEVVESMARWRARLAAPMEATGAATPTTGSARAAGEGGTAGSGGDD